MDIGSASPSVGIWQGHARWQSSVYDRSLYWLPGTLIRFDRVKCTTSRVLRWQQETVIFPRLSTTRHSTCFSIFNLPSDSLEHPFCNIKITLKIAGLSDHLNCNTRPPSLASLLDVTHCSVLHAESQNLIPNWKTQWTRLVVRTCRGVTEWRARRGDPASISITIAQYLAPFTFLLITIFGTLSLEPYWFQEIA